MAAAAQSDTSEWAGALAVFFPRPPLPAHLKPYASKAASKGTWLKAQAPATLRVGAALPGGALGSQALEIALQGRPLFRRPLRACNLKVLSPEETGGAWLALATAPAPPATGPAPLFCMHLPCDADGRSFAAAIAATFHQPAAEALAEPPMPQPGLAAGGEVGAAVGGSTGGAAGSEEPHPAAGAMAPAGGKRAFTAAEDDAIREGIKRFLADPGFAEYIEQVEKLWDSVEAQLVGD